MSLFLDATLCSVPIIIVIARKIIFPRLGFEPWLAANVFQKIEYLNLEHQLSRKLITMTALKVNKSRPLPFAGTLIIEKILFREVWSVRDMSPTALK